MTREQEKGILAKPSTHKLVHTVLGLTQDKDCVDSYYDILLVAEILKSRMDRVVCNNN